MEWPVGVGVATVLTWLGSVKKMEDMVLVGVEVEIAVLLEVDKGTEEHLGLLFASR